MTGLKKNLELSKPVKERLRLVDKDNKCITIKRQCELLNVNRSSIYYQPNPGGIYQVILRKTIDEIHMKHPYYGSRRMTVALKKLGFPVNRKRIQRYMREMRIKVYYPGPNLSKRNRKHKVYPYLLRNLNITKKNQVWAVDITYIPMEKGHMYLFAIIDWYSRQIIDYELSNTLDTFFITRCLKRAFKTTKPEIINCDQGCQFTSNNYIALLKEEKIAISMDSVGRATDNAIIERFFRSLKQEKVYIYEYTSPKDLSQLVNEYIHFYNNERGHQSLDNLTPHEVYAAA